MSVFNFWEVNVRADKMIEYANITKHDIRQPKRTWRDLLNFGFWPDEMFEQMELMDDG